MEEIIKLLNPAIISLIVTSIVAPLLFYFLKRRDDDRKRNYEVRYSEYKSYVQTLEKISRASSDDFESNFFSNYGEFFSKIINNPESVGDIIKTMLDNLNESSKKIREAFSRANSELIGLKLVCSDILYEKIQEYISIQEKLMNIMLNIIDRRNEMVLNPENYITGEFKELANKSKILYEEIILLMRKELKIK